MAIDYGLQAVAVQALSGMIQRAVAEHCSRSCLYVIAAPAVRRIKVGRSAEPKTRIRALSTASPVPVVTLAIGAPGSGHAEPDLHAALSTLGKRVNGEWFEMPSEILEALLTAVYRGGGELAA